MTSNLEVQTVAEHQHASGPRPHVVVSRGSREQDRRQFGISTSFLRYLLAAAFGFGASVGLTVFLTEIVGLRDVWSYAITICTMFVINFVLLRRFVFRINSGNQARQFGHVALLSVFFRTLEYVLFVVAVDVAGFHYVAAIIGIQGGLFVMKHRVYRWLFLRGTSDGRDSAPPLVVSSPGTLQEITTDG